MWKCPKCGESVEDRFEVCWNCGTSADGVVDVDVRPESGDPDVPEPGRKPGCDSTLPEEPIALEPLPGMNRREIAELICKTLALILFAVALIQLRSVLFALSSVYSSAFHDHSSDEFTFLVMNSLPVLGLAVLGAIYWVFSKTIASLMVSNDPRPAAIQPFTVRDAMIVVFSAVGLAYIVGAVQYVVRVAAFVREYSSGGLDSQLLKLPEVQTGIVQILLGLWLLLGSRGIVGAIYWCRSAGIRRGEDDLDRTDA